ncbi:MAG: hypothetical protein LQ344_006633 [Seirophora lacunosa]|nr:MAG: hypothetical protein LQ344_006633 [Seirophora lacunosa]
MSTHRPPPALRSPKATSFDNGGRGATENDPSTLLPLQHHVVDLELGNPLPRPEHKLPHELAETTRPRPVVRHHHLIRVVFVVLAALLAWRLLGGPVGALARGLFGGVWAADQGGRGEYVFPQLDPAAPNHMDGLRRF